MANLRPTKKVADKAWFGRFSFEGKTYDFREGKEWAKFTQEELYAFAQVHNKKTVDAHIIGDVSPKANNKKVTKAPTTDGKEEK